MKFSQGWYHFKEGCRSIFSHRLMSFASICMIVACLLIIGSFSLIAINVGNMLNDLEEQNEFLAYIHEDLSEEEARNMGSVIEMLPNVSDATFVTREEAMENFAADQDNELIDGLPAETLRHRYRIHVKDLSLLDDTIKQIEQLDGIADTRVAMEIAQGFVTVSKIASILAVVLAATLVVISFFIISNTTRITMFTRREEIAIMKMCGATDWFIRWPFIIEGVFLGVLGALLAFGLQWGVYGMLDQAVANFTNLNFIYLIPFQQIYHWVLGAFIAAGVVIGGLGSIATIRKFLRV